MAAWISVADIQTWLGPDVDTPTATLLAGEVTGAVMGYLEHDLSLRTMAEVLDSTGNDYILVNHWPIRTVTSIVINGQPPLVPAAFNVPGYRLDPLVTRMIRFPGRRIPRGFSNIAVGYTAGYDMAMLPGSATGLPENAYLALKLTAQAIWTAQAADPNLASENTGGVFSGSFLVTGPGAIPPAARGYLQPFKRVA